MSKLKVLVVDDAKFIRDRVTAMVRDAFPDSTVDACENGKDAIRAMQTTQYQILLCDWEMPVMSGLELLQWTRSQESYKNTPFLMVTSRGEREYVLKAIQAGVNDYLGKPFTSEQLVEKIIKALSKGGSLSPEQQARAAQLLQEEKTRRETPTRSMPKPKGLAQLRCSDHTFKCAIRDLTLREVRVVIKNEGRFPVLLDQVVVDIEQLSGDSVARINGFVVSMQASEANQNTPYVDVRVQFVDDDTDKMAHLSQYIASVR